MQNLELVKRPETADYLDYDLPYVLLFHKLFIVLALTNALEDVAIIGELHDDANKKCHRKLDRRQPENPRIEGLTKVS